MMIVVMKRDATRAQVERVKEEARRFDLSPIEMPGDERMIVALKGDERKVTTGRFKSLQGVSDVLPILKKYKMASRDTKWKDTIVDLGDGIKIGGAQQVVMAGPCTIENEQQLRCSAKAVHKEGVRIVRGGAYKPRTSPYAFQGLGLKGLQMIRAVADELGMKVITELMDIRKIDEVCRYADIIQIGARNMQNYDLLTELGKCGKPVMIKRGLSATLEEFLLAAEYIVSEGNTNVILCERGIRTFETEVRFTLNLGVVPILKTLTHLPIIIDPSHAMGRREYVTDMALAALAVGAHGIIVEVHCKPEEALCDGPQSLTPEMFTNLMDRAEKISAAVDMPLIRVKKVKSRK